MKIKLKVPLSTYKMHVFQFNPTLPLLQQLTLLLLGAWACRPDLIRRDPVLWRWPPGDAIASGYCGTCTNSPTNKNPSYAAFLPDSV